MKHKIRKYNKYISINATLFQYLVAAGLSWAVCGILTVTDVFPDDPSDPSYNARVDARADAIRTSSWITLSYPCKSLVDAIIVFYFE